MLLDILFIFIAHSKSYSAVDHCTLDGYRLNGLREIYIYIWGKTCGVHDVICLLSVAHSLICGK